MEELSYVKSIIRRLLKIDVSIIQYIPNTKPVSTKLKDFCISIANFFEHDPHITSEIISQEESYHKMVSEYEGSDPFNYKDLNNLLYLLKDLMDINENSVYYMCQVKAHPEYETYQLYHECGEILSELCEILCIPATCLGELEKTTSKEAMSNIWRDIYRNPNYPFFKDFEKLEKKEHLIKSKARFLEKFESEQDEFVEVSDWDFNYKESPEEEQATENDFRLNSLMRCLKKHSLFSEDMSFRGMSINGFRSLSNGKCGKHKLYTEKLSEKLTDDQIKEILWMFPELGFNGRLVETAPFSKRKIQQAYRFGDEVGKQAPCIGVPVLRNEDISLCRYANWYEEYNELLIKLFEHIGADQSLILYDAGKPVIKI